MIYGKLTGLHLGDLLQWLQVGRLSGRLTLAGEWERYLDFLDGRIVYVASNRPEERLANWLVRGELLPAVEMRNILGRSILERVLLTEVLVDRRGISQVELQRAVNELAGAIAQGILVERDLRFSFDPEYATRDLLNLDLDLDANSLLLEAARRLDEADAGLVGPPVRKIPFEGEAYEFFFRELVAVGVSEEESMDGDSVVEAHATLQKIMQVLARRLATGPGLVPMPATQAEALKTETPEPGLLSGNPQLVWNLLVLASTISTGEISAVEGMDQLLEVAGDMEILPLLGASEHWRRPENPRLDSLGSEISRRWAAAAACAAGALDLDPQLAMLGAHILSVPTDLVLWVLGSINIPHRGLRQALLAQLPEVVGQALSGRAGFPESLRVLFNPPVLTPLGAALEISRSVLPGADLWPALVGGDSSLLFEHLDSRQLRKAAEAIRDFES